MRMDGLMTDLASEWPRPSAAQEALVAAVLQQSGIVHILGRRRSCWCTPRALEFATATGRREQRCAEKDHCALSHGSGAGFGVAAVEPNIIEAEQGGRLRFFFCSVSRSFPDSTSAALDGGAAAREGGRRKRCSAACDGDSHSLPPAPPRAMLHDEDRGDGCGGGGALGWEFGYARRPLPSFLLSGLPGKGVRRRAPDGPLSWRLRWRRWHEAY